MKDLNEYYLKKEDIKNKLKLLDKEENEGMETIEKNYLLEKKRIRNQYNQKKRDIKLKMGQKKETLWKEEDEIEKKIRSLTEFIFQENAQKEQKNPSKNFGEVPRKKGKKQKLYIRLLLLTK